MATTKNRIGAKELGLELGAASDAESFKWLVACLLFGARINQELAAAAFTALDKDGVLTPRKLADADWQHLVDLLSQNGYRRYDESTARELISLGRAVLDSYGGKLTRIAQDASSKKEVSGRLQEFTGVGPKGAQIFLREMAPVWDL